MERHLLSAWNQASLLPQHPDGASHTPFFEFGVSLGQTVTPNIPTQPDYRTMKNSVFRRSLSALRSRRASALTGGILLAGAALTQGCLQRDVVKQTPNTSNIFVGINVNDTIDKIDLLFVIDNSVSMADKQAILQLAVPQMVKRLIDPQCVNVSTGETAVPTGGQCPAGFNREFEAVDDIHIGVITSSLGGHGSTQCARDEVDVMGVAYNKDDRGRLIPSVRTGAADPEGTGFLSWRGDPQDPQALVDNFTAQVGAAGERGCGFEATLEAWYRFLIDPQPPSDIVLEGFDSGMAKDANGQVMVDGTVLQQREAFLRPNSLVAIVVLSDENDCSVMDGGEYYGNSKYGWLVADVTRNMAAATPVCDTNPNDKCCFSCLQAATPPSGCDASSCTTTPELAPVDDRANVRCFDNKRRFGVDLMYPTSRYVDALSKGEIVDARTGNKVPNPLLRGVGLNAGKHRADGLVFFAGIVGLPWQDVATPESLSEAGTMKYLTAEDLLKTDDAIGGNRWQVILGQPNFPAGCSGAGCGDAPVPPLDPFMIESIAPRTTGAANPISGDLIIDYSSNDPEANSINGHEAAHNVADPRFQGEPANDDLQYSCIFPLATPKQNCTADDPACDCGDEPLRNRSLCQPPAGGAAGTTQYYGKAYPGTRILQVLRDFGDNSIVGSICPKITTGNAEDPNFGYNPAVQAIIDRLKEKLGGKCLPRNLSTNEDGSVPCSVIEARPGEADSERLDCNAEGRAEVTNPDIRNAVQRQLKDNELCGSGTQKNCDIYQMCQIKELVGEPREDCLYNTAPAGSLEFPGFCYIDPAKTTVDEDGNITGYPAGGEPPGGTPGKNPLVDGCAPTERRLLRFVGNATPAPNTFTVIACSGDAASADGPIPAPAVKVEPAPTP